MTITYQEIKALVAGIDRSIMVKHQGGLIDIQWAIRNILTEVFDYGVLDYRSTIVEQSGVITFMIYSIGKLTITEVDPEIMLAVLQGYLPCIISLEKEAEDDNARYMELFGTDQAVILRYKITFDPQKDER